MSGTRILRLPYSGGELWQGNIFDASHAKKDGFDSVFMCAYEHQPTWAFEKMLSPVEVIGHPFDDAAITKEHFRDAVRMARDVAKRVQAGRKVLVTCAMGLNRSGLVVALATFMLTNWRGEQIVHHIKARRGEWALSNPSFAAVVKKLRANV